MPRPKRNLTLSDEELSLWKRRLKDSSTRVEKLRDISKPFRKAFHGEFPLPVPSEDESEQIRVNRVHRVCTQWIGAMYAQNPKIRLKPPWKKQAGRDEVAKQEAIINGEMQRVGLEAAIKRAIQSAFLDGWGFIKSGFHAEWEPVAAELDEMTTDCTAENAGFDIGPEAWPKEVYLTEDHEEHIVSHEQEIEKSQGLLKQIQQTVQQVQQQAMQQGIDPKQVIDPALMEEAVRLMTKVQGIEQHLELHARMAKKRDEQGENPTNIRITAESCWTDYIHNSNVCWDQHATSPDDWRWIAERLIKPVEWFEKTFKTKEIAANFRGPRPGSIGDDEDNSDFGGVHFSKSEVGGDDPDLLAAVWKVWDIEKRRIIYIAEDADKAIRLEEWPHKFLKTAPIRMLYFELKEDEFTPIAPVTYFWDQQLEINRYRTKAGLVARRLSRQAIAHAMLDDEFISNVKEGIDGAIVKLNNPGIKPNEAFAPIEWGRIPQEWYALPAQAENDIQIDTGLGEVGLGSGVKAKTATAAQVQSQSASVPLDMKLRQIEKVVKEIASDLRALMRQYYAEARFSSYYWEGVEQSASWVGEDLAEFEIQVEFGSSRKQEQDVERMQWAQAIQLLANFPQVVNIAYLIREYIRRLGVPDTTEAMIDLSTQQPQMSQEAMGPGQGQNQTVNPQKVNGPPAAAMGQPAMDITKLGAR